MLALLAQKQPAFFRVGNLVAQQGQLYAVVGVVALQEQVFQFLFALVEFFQFFVQLADFFFQRGQLRTASRGVLAAGLGRVFFVAGLARAAVLVSRLFL